MDPALIGWPLVAAFSWALGYWFQRGVRWLFASEPKLQIPAGERAEILIAACALERRMDTERKPYEAATISRLRHGEAWLELVALLERHR